LVQLGIFLYVISSLIHSHLSFQKFSLSLTLLCRNILIYLFIITHGISFFCTSLCKYPSIFKSIKN